MSTQSHMNYLFRIVFALTALSSTVRASSSGIVSDDFNTFNLDPSVWTIVDPLADASFYVTGTNTGESVLNIHVPGGIRHVVDATNLTAPRIMQAVENTDFAIEVKYTSPLTKRFQQQGVLIQESDTRYLRCDFYSDGVSNFIYVATIDNGVLTPIVGKTISAIAPMYMRVSRNDHHWTIQYSHNGSSWTTAVAFEYAMTVAKVGPFVANDGSSPPAYTTQIDYFFNLESPIDPEDGAQVIDTFPPNLFSIRHQVESNRATILWSTDEPADSRVDFGLTADYELGSVFQPELVLHHAVTIEPLTPGTLYHYRVSSTDAAWLTAQSADKAFMTSNSNSPPMINVWYGAVQTFGHLGIPQPDVNILGNVSSTYGLQSFYYRLNNGPQRPLNVGPNSRRLADPGDFNVDLAYSELLPGSNQLVIYAQDTQNNLTQASVEVIKAGGSTWPLPYTIDWSTANSIEEVGQVTDGLWAIEGNKVRTLQFDYDRLIAFGDMQWQEYEVTVPITVHALDPDGYAAPSYGPAVGVLLHWVGNSADGSQPKQGFYPLGAIGMYRWQTSGNRYQIFGNYGTILANAPTSDVMQIGQEYIFKMRVEKLGSYFYYHFKAWPSNQFEPHDWKLIGAQAVTNDPGSGSALLLAHHVDASFGTVHVRPAPFDVEPEPVISNLQATPSLDSALITWETNLPATSRVRYGKTMAYELGDIESTALVTSHSIALQGLSMNTSYHFQAISVTESGIGTASADKSFQTIAGLHPDHWFDTEANYSLYENDTLFDAYVSNGKGALSTTSTASNIHSHFVSSASDGWATYTYMGRMMATDAGSSFGVTFLSDYPNSDAYYRIGSHFGQKFRLTARPSVGSVFAGNSLETPVHPVPNTWYRFRIQLADDGSRTTIKARIWPEGIPEPSFWQIHAHDTSPTRRTNGTVGLWSSGPGQKHWSDLGAYVPGGTPPPPLPPSRADFTGNGIVDEQDRDYLIGCFTGPSIPQTDPHCLPPYPVADLDGDGAVDMTDFGLLMRCFSSEGEPVDPDCMN